jgi:hypothetical protein
MSLTRFEQSVADRNRELLSLPRSRTTRHVEASLRSRMNLEAPTSSNDGGCVDAWPENQRASFARMESGAFWELGDVTDRDLQTELARLLANGARTEARIIAHLAAVEERRLHLEAGSSSLFDYCCHRLGLSENEAFHRITAARLARRFPAIFSLIQRRALHLTAVCLLRDYLTPENHRELLEEASGKTKLQVQEMLARRFPRPDVASTIRKLPSRRAQALLPTPARSHSAATPEDSNATSEAPSRAQVASSAESAPKSVSNRSRRRAIGFSSTPLLS